MARHKKSKRCGANSASRSLDYHEGLSSNQVEIILRAFSLDNRLDEFNEWMYGQTCPIVQRHNRHTGAIEETGGIYEYDLFRWISHKKRGSLLLWD